MELSLNNFLFIDSTVTQPLATTFFEVVTKSLKALNHEGHKEHKGKEKLFFVRFVSFVVPFFSEPFVTAGWDRKPG